MADHGETSEKILDSEDVEADDEVDDDEEDNFIPTKPVALKEQVELDKDDESLNKWKEQLLGDLSIVGDGKALELEVELLAVSIKVDGRPDIKLPVPLKDAPIDKEAAHFVLKEKSVYRLLFEFTVKNNLVLGLRYVVRVKKLGVTVQKYSTMMGGFGPQEEPHQYLTEEETTPHGVLARGHYTAKTTFVDDDGFTHFQFEYSFDIKKDWPEDE